ncbi:integrase arm-type DNA-binding domain-containing protein [uncultured Ferrimonas sp.]|uniref:integrase arm-type DNA-binding domain-containing protein n=1 Tax=uncultured Ferrimonas sp. TaxID=432640 RepID=UPI002630C423|nr:integrase arm-type DNA-binding domain-containing protein [uncultured Ferrimonas sp.]
MEKLPPKQQVLFLLEQCLATGVRGRIAEIIKHARAEIEPRDEFNDQLYSKASADLSDPNFPGLVFKVGKQSRRWIYRYTPTGSRSTKQRTLGYYPQMTVQQARAAWAQQRQPHAEPSDAVVSYSVGQLVADYLNYARHHRNEWQREQRLLERQLDDRFGGLDAAALNSDHIEQILSHVEQVAIAKGGHGQRAKEKALSILRHLYDVARGKTDYHDSSLPWLAPSLANPTEGISISRVAVMQTPLFAADVGRYLKALVGLPINEDVKALLMLQLGTMAPFSILCRLQWQHIDWQRQSIRFVGSKKQVQWLPLSTAALALLEQRRRQSRADQPWVFCATKQRHKPMPIHYPSQLLAALRTHLQLPNQFTAGKIIRFGLQWHQQQGSVIGQVGHPIQDSHFSLLPQAQFTVAAEQWQQYLTNLRQSS